MKPRIQLSKEKRDFLIASIKEFFRNEREEEIGDLAAILLLDFFMEKLAPAVYNQGIQDCVALFKEKLDDLEGLEI